MGHITNIRGMIRIDPPIPRSLWKNSDLNPDRAHSLGCDIVFKVEETDDGDATRRIAVGIVSSGEETRAYNIREDVQRVVDEFGEGRTFTGRLDLDCPDFMTQSRIKVIDGMAQEFEPTLVWPEASE